MGCPQVLIANEPRAYREALAQALRQLRPVAGVCVVTPDELDAFVLQSPPRLVIYSAPSVVVQTHVTAWVLLYPDGAPLVLYSMAGTQTAAADLDLSTLVALVDDVTPIVAS